MDIKRLNFTIESYKIHQLENSDLARVELYVCHDKFNKNGSYLQLKNMVRAQNTIYGKPLLYSVDDGDFEEHEETGKLRACGYISEYGNDIRYEEKDGKIYLVVSAIVWKVYMPEVIEIFERDGTKGISMEIKAFKTDTRKDGYIDILDYIYLSVVLLGDKYQTGMYNTTAELIEFSMSELNQLIEESEKNLKYMLLKNKMKEESGMKFDREAHAEKFKMTADDMMSAMRESAYAEGCYYVETFCSEFVYLYSYEDSKCYKVPYGMENQKCSLDFSNKKAVKIGFIDIEDGEEDYTVNFSTEIINEKEKEFNEKLSALETEKQEFSKQLDELKNKETELNSTIELSKAEVKEKEDLIFSLNEKIEELEGSITSKDSEIETLNKFKSEKDKEDRQKKVVELFSKLGKALSKTEIDDWKSKEPEYENLNDFDRDVRAFAFDKIYEKQDSDKEKTCKMGINLEGNDLDESEKESHKDVWDKFKKTK